MVLSGETYRLQKLAQTPKLFHLAESIGVELSHLFAVTPTIAPVTLGNSSARGPYNIQLYCLIFCCGTIFISDPLQGTLLLSSRSVHNGKSWSTRRYISCAICVATDWVLHDHTMFFYHLHQNGIAFVVPGGPWQGLWDEDCTQYNQLPHAKLSRLTVLTLKTVSQRCARWANQNVRIPAVSSLRTRERSARFTSYRLYYILHNRVPT